MRRKILQAPLTTQAALSPSRKRKSRDSTPPRPAAALDILSLMPQRPTPDGASRLAAPIAPDTHVAGRRQTAACPSPPPPRAPHVTTGGAGAACELPLFHPSKPRQPAVSARGAADTVDGAVAQVHRELVRTQAYMAQQDSVLADLAQGVRAQWIALHSLAGGDNALQATNVCHDLHSECTQRVQAQLQVWQKRCHDLADELRASKEQCVGLQHEAQLSRRQVDGTAVAVGNCLQTLRGVGLVYPDNRPTANTLETEFAIITGAVIYLSGIVTENKRVTANLENQLDTQTASHRAHVADMRQAIANLEQHVAAMQAVIVDKSCQVEILQQAGDGLPAPWGKKPGSLGPGYR